MASMIYYSVLFLVKVFDNALSTTKTIVIQRSRWLLVGIAVVLSDFIYFWLTKRIVAAGSNLAILIVALVGGVGCVLACLFSKKLCVFIWFFILYPNRTKYVFESCDTLQG